MQKVLSYPLTAVYFLFFGLTLLVFHPIQWICFRFFGYDAHKRSVSLLNATLLRCTHILGTRYTFTNTHSLPTNRPLIIVANHQSMHDIPPLIWFLRAHHPKFVSKIELGKGIPSVSFNLRHGGAALIDRNDSKQAVAEITKLGQYIETHNRSAVIFPEGTRSRTGHPKNFQPTGLKILLKNAPSALIVPITINNSWKMLRYGKFPYGLGNHLSFEIHEPIENRGNADDLIERTKQRIIASITSFA
ncbi:lysophospholipid acyltransferase family protein [Arenibacter sp. GZD96]|uniref:lysophospholipid acyltransferase family protein n=1 Tax=Aurantibrevibacter litoralis TaxID=3106030 RepID=UPI002B002097|nr:lysophospholipid acyltransferase family protein [Arenibacter sp. GZD-96]MEA1786619.1 lysophospholipid acyltransferase family protein [Arenibacter sp. GZD-96]